MNAKDATIGGIFAGRTDAPVLILGPTGPVQHLKNEI